MTIEEESQRQCAVAWNDVANLLERINPEVWNYPGCGSECALFAIQRLHDRAESAEKALQKVRARRLELKRINRAHRLLVLEYAALKRRYENLQQLGIANEDAKHALGYEQGYKDGFNEKFLTGVEVKIEPQELTQQSLFTNSAAFRQVVKSLSEKVDQDILRALEGQ